MRILLLTILVFEVLAGYALAQDAKPGILVTPTRVVMDGKTRSFAISLANNGELPGTYKLSIVNKRMLENGSLVDVEAPEEGELFADKMLRISPRRISLNPGAHQRVRILARKPRNLAPGEYRSHLHVLLMPTEAKGDVKDDGPELEEERLSIKIEANFGITIPVIVRHGDNLQESGTISDINLIKQEDGEEAVTFFINRFGDRSLYGDLRVTYNNEAGQEYILKNLGGIAVYTPNEKRQVLLPLDIPDGVEIKGGSLEVSYFKKEEDGGKLIASNKINL